MNRQDARNARGLQEPATEIDTLASGVVEAAVEVHRVLGPGFFEGVYEQALDRELTLRRVPFVRLVINFNVPVLLHGVRRVVLSAPSSP